MEITELVTTTLAIASPFIGKIGEGTARKIGEDIWNLLSKTFQKKEKNIEEMNKEDIQAFLIEVLNEDAEFKSELEKTIMTVQSNTENINQTIVNNGNIEKQVNIGNNIGNISF